MSNQEDKVKKIVELTGFDPVKKQPITEEIFKQVVKEFQEQRVEEAVKKARELLGKLFELRETRDKAEKEFNGHLKRFDKEAGKILNQIENDLRRSSGQQTQEEGTSEENQPVE